MADEQQQGQQTHDAAGTAEQAQASTEQATVETGKTFTQAELDEIIRKRLEREGKKTQAEIDRLVNARVQAELERQKLSAEEQAKLRAQEAEQKAAAAIAQANARLVASEAQIVALAAGVNPEYVNDVLTLAGISGEKHVKDGEPDVDAIRASINAVLEKRPFFKAGAGQQDFGRDLGSGNATAPTQVQLQQQYAEALKKGDIPLALRLKDQLFELQHKGA